MEPQQCRPRQAPAVTLLHQPVERSRAQRLEAYPLAPLNRRDSSRDDRFAVRPHAGQQPDRGTVQPASRESQRPSRRAIQPLCVIDSNEYRTVARKQTQRRRKRCEDSARLRWPTLRRPAEERDLERLTLRLRQQVENLLVDTGKQIRQAGERKRGVGLRRPAAQQPISTLALPRPIPPATASTYRSPARPRSQAPPGQPLAATREKSRHERALDHDQRPASGTSLNLCRRAVNESLQRDTAQQDAMGPASIDAIPADPPGRQPR